MTRKKYLIICDESGSTGFSDKPGKEGYEIGVVSGILLEDVQEQTIADYATDIALRFHDNKGKFHIADLTPKRQQALRDTIYSAIIRENLHIVYEAYTQSGFHDYFEQEKKFFESLKSSRKENGFCYSTPDTKKRMLTMLYFGVIIRALEFLCHKEKHPYEFDLTVVTDKLDGVILTEIKGEVSNFLNIRPIEKRHVTATRYNIQTKSVELVSGNVTLKISENNIGDFSGVNITARVDTKCSIFADVLANSILHCLQHSFSTDKFASLTTPKAIERFELSNRCVSLTPNGQQDMMQNLFRFPRSDGERMSADSIVAGLSDRITIEKSK